MNLLGNALRTHVNQESNGSVEIRITDTGIGMSKDFLFQSAFEPFRKRNQHSSGMGVGLTVVRRIIEDIGGSIKIKSEQDIGTDITVQVPLEHYDRPYDPDSSHSAIYATLSQLKGRKVVIFHSKAPDANGPLELLRQWGVLKRYITTLMNTVRNELHMDVTQTSKWTGLDECDIVICPEISFDSLKAIRDKAIVAPPATLFIAMDMVEANTLRCDARITSQSSVIEIMTQPYVK
jgi:hypothetical protein